MKIAVGLSGGVDSSVAAALLLEQGHDVIGVMMKHSQDGKYKTDNRPACFGGDEQEEINAAGEVAETLGISFHVVDLTKEYEEIVLNFFRSEYLAGRTPNPCIRCNQQLKFQLLIDKSKILHDFDFFATGHYARVEFDSMTNRYLLKRAKYIKKDQSYFLSQLTQGQLSRVMFPLGNLTKAEVREIAAKYKLPTSDKEESQDFFSGDYKDLFANLPPKGDIVDGSGKILGRHSGIISYTIGQRKGLGISSSEPLYVTKIDAEKNRIIVGSREDLLKNSLIAYDINWIKYDKPDKPLSFSTRIRYGSAGEQALISALKDNEWLVSFDKPQSAVTPGQAVVFYEDDYVVGGGFIKAAAELP